LYEQTEGREFNIRTGNYEGEFTGKGLLDIEVIRKIMEIEENILKDERF
jgi:hypothetical protein